MAGLDDTIVCRDDDGVLELRWDGGAEADVFVSEVAHQWSAEPDYAGVTSPLRVAGLTPLRRHYFLLRIRAGTAPHAVAERVLPMYGGTNFRDFGGYATSDGRRVRWGRLYRSGHMATLNDADCALFDALDIRVNCDFRRPEERRNEPSLLPATTEVLGLSIDPGSASDYFNAMQQGGGSAEQMAQFMVSINEEFVLHHHQTYRQMFDALLALEQGALLINCSAGKDRTGFAAALILMALGVPRQTIMADYLLSANYFPIDRELGRVMRKYGPATGGALSADLLRPMMETRIEYLQCAFDTIDRQFGGTDAFLADQYRLDARELDVLRARYTIRET